MSRILKLTLVTVTAVAIIAGLVWSYLAHRSELAGELQSDQPIKNPTRVTQGASGETVVKFDRGMQQRMDIQAQTLVAMTRTAMRLLLARPPSDDQHYISSGRRW